MRYLVLIYVDEAIQEAPPEGLIDAMIAYCADDRFGRLVTDAGLTPSASATRVTSRDGAVTTTDGPFAEAKEVVGGFMLIETATSEDAAAWTRGFVDLHAEHWPTLEVTTELRQVAGSLSD